jgi:hypothetical protein
MVVANRRQRISQLLDVLFPEDQPDTGAASAANATATATTTQNAVLDTIIFKMRLAELYFLRDQEMELDAGDQISWAFRKLRASNRFNDLLTELAVFEGSKDNSAFYKCCSLDALFYLGY